MIEKEIINLSMEYILQHLEDDLTVQKVASHFNFSEAYFNRAFRSRTGESVYAFIKRQKLNQSAIEMKLNRDKTITDIGVKYGYSASNYSSAFKKVKKVSPVKFREETYKTSKVNPFYEDKLEQFETFETYDKKISIQYIQDISVLYERFIGNYNDLKAAWYQLMDDYIMEITPDTVMVERFYDDPRIAEVNRCICDLCISVEGVCKRENTTIIKGGKFAVYRYEGKIIEIYGVLQGIFCIWLPQSPYEMDKRYGLNIYRKVDHEKDIVTMDLCIPIK